MRALKSGESVAEEVVMIPMESIEEPEKAVREKMTEEGLEELSKSIVLVGLINPVILRSKGNGYEIGKGHRRFLAIKLLGWEKIPAIIRDRDDKRERVERLHENLHREDMSPIEEGKTVRDLMSEGGYSRKDVAKVCKKTESWVEGRLNLLTMPQELQDAVDVGALSIGAARELAGITDDAAREYHTEYAIKQGATAALCAFWRGRWELNKLVSDPSGMGEGIASMAPLTNVITMACQWCDQEEPLHLMNHLRVCPRCTQILIETKKVMAQERYDAKRRSTELNEDEVAG